MLVVWGLCAHVCGVDNGENVAPGVGIQAWNLALTCDGLAVADVSSNGTKAPCNMCTPDLQLQSSFKHVVIFTGCQRLVLSSAYVICAGNGSQQSDSISSQHFSLEQQDGTRNSLHLAHRRTKH